MPTPVNGLTSTSTPRDEVAHRPRWRSRYRHRLVAADATVATTAGLAAAVLLAADTGVTTAAAAVAALPVLWLALVWLAGGYDDRHLHVGGHETRRMLLAGLAMISTGGVVLEVVFGVDPVGTAYATWLTVLLTGTLAARVAFRCRLHRRWRSGRDRQRTVLVGPRHATAATLRLLSTTRRRTGMEVVASCLCETDGSTTSVAGVRVVGGATPDQVAAVVAEHDADRVVVLPCEEFDGSALRRLTSGCGAGRASKRMQG